MNTPTQSPAADSVMDIHSCSYYCQLPKCVLRQRDELVRVYVEGWKEKEPEADAGGGDEPVGYVTGEGTVVFYVDNFSYSRKPKDGTEIYTRPQPTTPPAVEGGMRVPFNHRAASAEARATLVAGVEWLAKRLAEFAAYPTNNDYECGKQIAYDIASERVSALLAGRE